MPKPRRESGRKPQKIIVIVCEGEKTEVNYFRKFRDSLAFPGNLVKIEVVHVGKTSHRELVEAAVSFGIKNIDESWVVVDKDGYTKHHEAFQMAEANSVNIAFSSISFEVWILLHFLYSSKDYNKCIDVIHDIKHIHRYDYEKNNENLFDDMKERYDFARKNAIRLRLEQSKNNPCVKIHDLNPYTDVDLLTEKMIELKNEIVKQKNS